MPKNNPTSRKANQSLGFNNMALRIEMNYMNSSGKYDVLLPETRLKTITGSRVGTGTDTMFSVSLVDTFTITVPILFMYTYSNDTRNFAYGIKLASDGKYFQTSTYIGQAFFVVFPMNKTITLSNVSMTLSYAMDDGTVEEIYVFTSSNKIYIDSKTNTTLSKTSNISGKTYYYSIIGFGY